MRVILLFAVLVNGAAYHLSAVGKQWATPGRQWATPERACVRMGESAWAKAKRKREERERQAFAEQVEREAAAKAEREAAAKLEREAEEARRLEANKRMQNYQDNVDFDRPGGVLRQHTPTLTKGDLENAQVLRSPIIDAEKRLQDASARSGSLASQAEAISLLREALEEADKARVPKSSPQRRAAAALLSAYELAVDDATAPTVDSPPKDEMQTKMEAIFSDEYSIPGLDDDL